MNKALSQNKAFLRLFLKIAAKRKAKKNPHCVIMQSAPKDEAPAPEAPEAPVDAAPEEPDNTPVVTGEMEAAPSEGTDPEQPAEETAPEPAAEEKPEPVAETEQAPAPEPEAEQELAKPRRKYRSKKKAAE